MIVKTTQEGSKDVSESKQLEKMALRMTSVKQRWENYTDRKRKMYVDCKAVRINTKLLFSAKRQNKQSSKSRMKVSGEDEKMAGRRYKTIKLEHQRGPATE